MLNPMQDRGGALAADPEQCEAEPIHIPGTIQPHGVLLALEGPSFRIVEASQSCEALLGKDAAELLDQDLEHAFGRDLAAGLREAADRYASLPSSPARFEWPSERLSRAFEAYVHRSGPLTVLELTPAPHPREDSGLLLREASQALRAVQAQADSVSKSSVAAQYVRRLTGYDRVMIYRFHEDWHGEVVAEDRRADLEPYLGLHYPASDIPSQARRLFLASPSRVIADVEYVPSPILVSERLAVPGALDLSQSVLRSVSPVHLEYLRNMEVGATLVASLAVGDRLLGLVSCQHTSPRQPSGAIRDILDRIAQDLATQLALEEEVRSRQYSTMLGNCQAALVRAMRHGARLRDLLRGTGLADLLGAVAADGVALISESELACGGATPDPADIRRIAAQLQEPRSAAPEGCIVTDCLSGLLPEMARLAATASGMMMLPMDSKLPLRLMFFRGERLRTVTWAGDPDKRGAATAEGRLSPRRSFAAWSESVRHRSTPWRTEEIGAARALATTIDIEMRRVAEDGLRATETLLEEAMNSLSAHIAVLDQDGVIVTVNESWRRFAACNGGTGNCLPGVNYLSACTSALGTAEGGVAAAALLGIREVLAGTRDFLSLEYPCDSPTEARWFVMRVYRMTGTRAGAVVAHEEITGSKRAERDLLASEARFRTLSEDSSDGVWVVKDGRIVYANPAALALWGESDPAALLGQTILDRIHPEDRQTIVARIAALQGGGPPTPPRIIRLLRRDGTAIEIEGRGNLIQFDGGPAIGVVARDPSERRRAERVLRESEHRFRSVIASMEEGVVLADATGTFQLWNPATERILGLSGEQLAGRSSVDPRWRATDESGTELRNDQHFAMLALHTGKPAGGYIRVERGDGTWAWLQVNAVPLFHPGEPAAYAVTATFADVTQRRELERELVHKQAELEQLNRLLEERVASAVAELRSKDQLFIVQGRQAAMGEMIGNIAHQWRQPLNALGLVLANLEDARSVGALDSSAVTQAISSGTALVQRMSSTINDFRNFFRPGKEREAFQVRTQVEQAASLVEASFRHSHIEIRIAAVNDLWLFGFPNEYAQVLLNLLVNAKDAIQERGIAPGLITISASARESESVLTVLDNGGGFPAGVLDRVFDPYFSTRESGSGIGLYMCKMIIESMGGRIEARNRGPGAELVVSCPLAREIP